MKYVISLCGVIAFGFIALPVAVSAHGDAAAGSSVRDGAHHMMQEVMHETLSDEEYERMEELMTKMMSGTLSDDEVEELAVFMQEHPGSYNMMMRQFDGESRWSGNHQVWSMMGGGMVFARSWWPWLMGLSVLATLVWVGVGVALIVLIMKRARKDK